VELEGGGQVVGGKVKEAGWLQIVAVMGYLRDSYRLHQKLWFRCGMWIVAEQLMVVVCV
jgi:hypothetical protein